MRQIRLNDGTVLENASVLLNANDALFFYIKDLSMSMEDVFLLMNDPEKTAKIVSVYNTNETEYTGYTDLTSISKTSIQISGSLQKGN